MQIRHCLPSAFLVCLILTAFLSVSGGCGYFQGASEPEQVQPSQPEVEKKSVAVYH